jgi:hypothetical protein
VLGMNAAARALFPEGRVHETPSRPRSAGTNGGLEMFDWAPLWIAPEVYLA